MKKTLVVAVVLMLFSTLTLAEGKNLLKNPGFEGVLSPWQNTRADNGMCEIDIGEVFSGESSLRLEVKQNEIYVAQRLIPIKGGETYYVSFWAKTDNIPSIQNGQLFTKVEWWDDANYIDTKEKIVEYFTRELVEDKWVKCSTSFKAPPEATRVTLLLRIRGDGTRAWFDEAYLGLEPSTN